ncbi:ornithine cyclodeaminase family protein [Rubritalea tangerina]|uniref:Ornithine cyclodeaminase family protein n=1 Tax=Rubritalea tangerina TaxID=430798 RepID=A0ABW4ZDH4_9BACT
MEIRLIGAEVIEGCLGMPRTIELMEDAFRALSEGGVQSPLRTAITNGEGTVLYKPAYSEAAGIFCVKVVSVFSGNAALGLPVTPGIIVINSEETGMPLAVLEAGYLTSLRTGAATGLATKLFAKPDAKIGALFGTGGQARHQLEAMLCVREFETIYVFSRNEENAERFCRENLDIAGGCRLVANPARSVLASCDVLTLATSAASPLFEWSEVGDDVHINAVGSLGPKRTEVSAETLLNSRVIVDQREACLAEAGEICLMREAGLIGEDYHPSEMGELIDGAREMQHQPTVFKSVGNAVQDLVCSAEIYQTAKREDMGKTERL